MGPVQRNGFIFNDNEVFKREKGLQSLADVSQW